MRHVRSILYALVLAPAIWVLCGVGFTQDLTGRARDASGGFETVSAILLLVLAGLAFAILLFAPISPAGPASAGLVFLAVSLWALITPDGYAGVWPAGVTKESFDLSRPGYALAVLLGIPLLCTALSARRWERYEPPQLPIIGTLGRARGKAAVPGTPVSAARTAVISTADPTEVITLPAPATPTAPANETTAIVPPAASPTSNDEPTAVFSPADAEAKAGAEPTALVTPPATAPAKSNEDSTTISPPVADAPPTTGDDDSTTIFSPAAGVGAPTSSAENSDEPAGLFSLTEPTPSPADETTMTAMPDTVEGQSDEQAGRETAEDDETATHAVDEADEPTTVFSLADGDPDAQRGDVEDEPTTFIAVDAKGEATAVTAHATGAEPEAQAATDDGADAAEPTGDEAPTVTVTEDSTPAETDGPEDEPTVAVTEEQPDEPAVAAAEPDLRDDSAAVAPEEPAVPAVAADEPVSDDGPHDEDEPTAAAAIDSDDSTVVVVDAAAEEPTAVIATGDADEPSEKTTEVSATADEPDQDAEQQPATTPMAAGSTTEEPDQEDEDQPTTTAMTTGPTTDDPDQDDEDQPTGEPEDDEPATTVFAVEEADEEPETTDLAAEQAEQDEQDEEAEQDEATADVTGDEATSVLVFEEPTSDIAGDEPTTVLASDEPTTDVTGDDEATTLLGVVGERDTEDVLPAARRAGAGPGETTVATPWLGTPESEDGEKTQVIRLPRADEVGSGPTRDFRGGGKTYLDGPGEQTQVIFRRDPAEDPAEQQAALDRAAQERARQAFRDRAAQERARQAFADRAAAEARQHGDETQVINILKPTAPAEQTQMLGKIPEQRSSGTVAPPEEHTQVLRFPASPGPGFPAPAGGDSEPEEPAPSILDEEQPDPGADPTTLLGVAPEKARDASAGPKIKSVLDLERPADEIEDDTRPLRPIDPDQER